MKPKFAALVPLGVPKGPEDTYDKGAVSKCFVSKHGFNIYWTMLFSYPLMAAIQVISGRIGRTTGRGHCPRRKLTLSSR
jgi:hypothetical protein